MVEMYYEKDADKSVLESKTIAVIGYGSQGHAQAQNLRDSGCNVIVAEVPGTPNAKLAEEHGFSILSAAEAAEQAQVIQILVPDPVQAAIYKKEIAPHMQEDDALVFSHGFNIHYEQILPPDNVDVIMVAPKGPGHLVRSEYEKGGGVPCLIAVEQDHSGQAKQVALAYALGIGGTRAGVIETTFDEETETDLFGEQVVLCGGVTALVKAAFEVLTEAGYQPEIAYFEVLNELKLIVDLMYEGGLTYMRYSVSDTAEHGDYTGGPKVITDETRETMWQMLEDIRDGTYAQEWIEENKAGRPNFNRWRREDMDHPIEQVGRELRNMMPWLEAKDVPWYEEQG